MSKTKYEEHFDEGWLLPYSDLMTLLLAVFIVLFAISKDDKQKLEEIAESFSEVVLSQNTSTIKSIDSKGVQTSKNNIEQIKENIDEYIKENNLIHEISTQVKGEKLKIVIANNILYKSGSADVSEVNIELSSTIGKLILARGKNMEVKIVGHTDNVPMHSEEFKDNIELSQKRAYNFLNNVLKTPGLDPTKFSTSGYGEYQPIATNDTEEGKKLNRRVEILIDAELKKETK